MTLMKRLRRSPSLDYESLELMRSPSLEVIGRSTKHAGSKEIMPKAKLGKIKEFLAKKKALSIGAWKYNNPPRRKLCQNDQQANQPTANIGSHVI